MSLRAVSASVVLGGNTNTTWMLLSYVYLPVASMVDWLSAKKKKELR
jgi:hypothetical protein